MPPLTRLFIKTSLLYFVAALLAALLLVTQPLFELPPILSAIGPVYIHMLMVGWVTQLIIGVAYWMFPRYTREKPRGHETLAWITYFLLNGGLLLRVIGEPARSIQTGAVWGWMLALSALLQWLAGLIFVVNTWPRLQGK